MRTASSRTTARLRNPTRTIEHCCTSGRSTAERRDRDGTATHLSDETTTGRSSTSFCRPGGSTAPTRPSRMPRAAARTAAHEHMPIRGSSWWVWALRRARVITLRASAPHSPRTVPNRTSEGRQKDVRRTCAERQPLATGWGCRSARLKPPSGPSGHGIRASTERRRRARVAQRLRMGRHPDRPAPPHSLTESRRTEQVEPGGVALGCLVVAGGRFPPAGGTMRAAPRTTGSAASARQTGAHTSGASPTGPVGAFPPTGSTPGSCDL